MMSESEEQKEYPLLDLEDEREDNMTSTVTCLRVCMVVAGIFLLAATAILVAGILHLS